MVCSFELLEPISNEIFLFFFIVVSKVSFKIRLTTLVKYVIKI